MEGADKERNRLLLVQHTHIHNTRPFSKTHLLMMTINQGADKKRNMLLVVKQNTRPFSKTHHLMLAMERANKERNQLLPVKTYMYTTQDHSVKLTS